MKKDTEITYLMATQLDLEAKAAELHKHSTAPQQIISAPRTIILAER